MILDEESTLSPTEPASKAPTPPFGIGARKRNPAALRRVNLASNLSKNIQFVAVKLEETNASFILFLI